MTELEVLTNETNREMAQLRHEIEELTHALAESRRLHHNALVRVHRLARVTESVRVLLALRAPLSMPQEFQAQLAVVGAALNDMDELRDAGPAVAVTDLAAVRRAWQAFQDARGSDEIAAQADLLDDLLGVDSDGTVL